jgi:hypothetical protein
VKLKSLAPSFIVLALVFVAVLPAPAGDKKKKAPDRAMLEKMDAVPCGTKQQGVTGLGSIWASVGITHLNADEKLCPRYLLRTDDMEYEVQPTEKKHPVILPVGHEVVIKIKKDRMVVRCPDEGDKKSREYEVVAMKPTDTTPQEASTKPDKP